MRSVIGGISAAIEHDVVTGLFAFLSQSRAHTPGERIEPIDDAQKLGERTGRPSRRAGRAPARDKAPGARGPRAIRALASAATPSGAERPTPPENAGRHLYKPHRRGEPVASSNGFGFLDPDTVCDASSARHKAPEADDARDQHRDTKHDTCHPNEKNCAGDSWLLRRDIWRAARPRTRRRRERERRPPAMRRGATAETAIGTCHAGSAGVKSGIEDRAGQCRREHTMLSDAD